MLHDHPKVVDAGPWAMAVITAAWRLSKAHDLGGILPAAFWTPGMMARWTLYGNTYAGGDDAWV